MFCRLCGKISGGGRCIYCGNRRGSAVSSATGQSAVQETAPASGEDYLSRYYAAQNPGASAPAAAPAPPKPVNGPAVASFVTAFFGVLFIVSFILGIVGLKKAKTLGSGKGFAIAGIVLSVLCVIDIIVMIVIFTQVII